MAGITFAEASGVNDSIYGKSQAPIRLVLEKKAEAFEQAAIAPKIFKQEKSKRFAEKMTALTAMSGFQPVGEMGSHPHDNMRESYSKVLEHEVWKDRFTISREMIDDANVVNMRNKPVQFVTGYYRTRERFGAALLGAAIREQTSATFGGKSFGTTTADGVCLFSTSHPSILGGAAQSNKYADAFNADVLGAAETAMQSYKGDNGKILAVSPDTIIIPNDYALKNAVFAAVGSDKSPDTANNAFNYQFGRWNVIVWPYLNEFITSGTSPWILMDSTYNEEALGAAWFDRVSLEVTSHLDYDTNANVWDGYARFAAGFNDWRAFCVGGVAGATNLIS